MNLGSLEGRADWVGVMRATQAGVAV